MTGHCSAAEVKLDAVYGAEKKIAPHSWSSIALILAFTISLKH